MIISQFLNIKNFFFRLSINDETDFLNFIDVQVQKISSTE